RAREDFLQAQDLRTLRCSFFDQLQMLFDRIALDLFERFVSGSRASSLNEGTSNNAGHGVPFFRPSYVRPRRLRRGLRAERSQYRTNANPNVTNHAYV